MNRKAQSGDTGILFGIILILIVLVIAIPYVLNSFSVDSQIVDVGSTADQLRETAQESGVWSGLIGGLTNTISVLFSIFVWNLDVNMWINLFYLTPLRILGYYIIIRLIRGV